VKEFYSNYGFFYIFIVATVGFCIAITVFCYLHPPKLISEVTVCFEDETTRCFCRNEYTYNKPRAMSCMKK